MLEILIKESESKMGSYPCLLSYIVDRYGGFIPGVGGLFLGSIGASSREKDTCLGGGVGVWRGSPQGYPTSSSL